jgi:signal transduction histidine kinase
VSSYSILFALTFAALVQLAGWLAVSGYRGPVRAGTAAFSPLMVAITVRTVAAILAFLAPTLSGKVLAAKLELTSFVAIGPLWLAFALQYTGRAHLLSLRNQVLLIAPSLLTALLALTNEAHGLIWTDLRLDPVDSAGLIAVRGAWAQAYAVLNYAYLLAGIILYIVEFARATSPYRRQMGIIMAGSLVPLMGNALTLAGVTPSLQMDVSQVSLPIASALFALGQYRYGGPELAPVAARVVMDNLRDPVIVLDASQRLIDLNAAARRLLNLKDDDIGRKALEVLKPPEVWRPYIDRSEAQTEVQIGEADRGRWYQLTISPLRGPADTRLGSVALLHDISQERALLRMRDDLTHMLVHDLRNPFSSIYSALQLIDTLLQEEADDEAASSAADLAMPRADALHGAIAIALQSSSRAQEMLDSLLDLNRLEGGQMPVKPIPLEAALVAEAVLREMTPFASRRGLTLDLAIPDSLPDGYADKGLLDRVLRNLVGNAIKFTPSGGRVKLAAQVQDSLLVLSVSDTGPGIPEQVQTRLFQKFVRGPGPAHGSGLGLAFCRLAVEAMGGRIWADNTPGGGATFHFTIPQSPLTPDLSRLHPEPSGKSP